MSFPLHNVPSPDPADTQRAVAAFWGWWDCGGADALDRLHTRQPGSNAHGQCAEDQDATSEVDRLVAASIRV